MKNYVGIIALVMLASCGKGVRTKVVEVDVTPRAAPKLECKVFDMSSTSLSALPNFKTLNTLGSFEVESLNNATSNNLTPFNSFLDTDLVELTERFGMVCEGTLDMVSGSYSFFLNSDDGSRLYINDFLVVDNNGNHGAIKRGANVVLLAGKAKFRVEYFNGDGDKTLVLSMRQPGIPFEELVRF
jgi:hypothetical protein